MTDDVVAELGEWLDRWRAFKSQYRAGDEWATENLMQRARDEIQALRKLTDGDWVWKQITETRTQALEEAARIADGYCTDRTDDVAAAIRALKEQ